MQLTLLRTGLYDDCTEGVLTVGTKTYRTIEQPWDFNLPFHSCVPPGLYKLVPHDSPKHPHTYALVNEQLLIYHQLPPDAPYGARADCLIHAANWASQLQGCIAPGLDLVDSARGPMVTSSGIALQRILTVLGVGFLGHTIVISQE